MFVKGAKFPKWGPGGGKFSGGAKFPVTPVILNVWSVNKRSPLFLGLNFYSEQKQPIKYPEKISEDIIANRLSRALLWF